MSDAPRIVYQPRPDATPETEVSVLAQIYKFVLQSKAAEPAPEPDGHDGTKVQGVSADAPIIRAPARS